MLYPLARTVATLWFSRDAFVLPMQQLKAL